MSPDSVERVHSLWDDLADFPVGRSVDAADYLMTSLLDLGGVSHATWAGAIRMSHEPVGDPLLGWRVAQMRALQPAPAPADDSHFRDLLRIWDRREIDPSFLLPLRDLGAFRTYSLRGDLPPAWFDTPFYKTHYGAAGICDAAFVAFPLSEDCESHFGFYAREPIPAAALELLTYALRGIKWFHRQLMLSHGLLLASTPLTATEQKVLQLLLTDASEKRIAHQLGLAGSTTHQHVVAIYRKFGIRSRAALMSLWLSPAADRTSSTVPTV